MQQPKKILVIRLKQIGDALVSLPVCNSLRKTYPDAQIDYLVYQHIKTILEGQPHIDNILVVTPEERRNKWLYFKKILWLRKQNYDLVLDLINVPISVATTYLSGAQQTIGFDKQRWRKNLYKTTVVHADVGDTLTKKLDILKGLPDQAIIDRHWHIAITDVEKTAVKAKLQQRGVDVNRPMFFIAATSRRDYKFWPTEYVTDVLNHLKQRYNAQLILNWLPGPEGEFVNQLVAQLDNSDDVFPDIALTLRELPVAISLCDFFFGNDGGPNHMAVGTGIPSLAVFSPVNQKSAWLPIDNPKHQGIDLTDALQIDDQTISTMEQKIKQDVNGYYRKITPQLVIDKLDTMLMQVLA